VKIPRDGGPGGTQTATARPVIRVILPAMRQPASAGWRRVRAAGVVALAIVLVASSVAAAPIPPALADPGRDADLATIARALESRLVAAHLRSVGLTPEAVQARLAQLDDGELRRMAQAVPELGAGGQQDLTGEQKAGVILLLLVALAVFGGLLYLALAGL
jgi:hypothetical protein